MCQRLYSPCHDVLAASFQDWPGNETVVLGYPRLLCSEMQICRENLVSFLTCSICNWKGLEFFRAERQHFTHHSSNYMFSGQCVGYSPLASYICEVSHPLPSLFLLFWVFGYAPTQLRFCFFLLPLMLLMWDSPGSLRLHNFNVYVPEQGGLGKRLWQKLFGCRLWMHIW